jgi:quercetin dioxygenase-like cupin family protein
MSEAIFVAPGQGEVVGDSPDRRVEILSDDETVHATWSRFGPGREGADLHVHRRHSDLFYVLAGELTVRLGREDLAVAIPARTLARLPPLVVHGFRNGGDRELRYLNLHAPGVEFADYMRGLRDGRAFPFDQEPPPPDGVRPPTEAALGGTGFAADRPGLRQLLLTDVEAIAIAEAQAEPGGEAPGPHVHRRHVESFYVLDGELELTAGARTIQAPAGSWLQVPPGVRHALSFRAPVRYLDLHTPNCGFAASLRGEPGFDQEPAP